MSHLNFFFFELFFSSLVNCSCVQLRFRKVLESCGWSCLASFFFFVCVCTKPVILGFGPKTNYTTISSGRLSSSPPDPTVPNVCLQTCFPSGCDTCLFSRKEHAAGYSSIKSSWWNPNNSWASLLKERGLVRASHEAASRCQRPFSRQKDVISKKKMKINKRKGCVETGSKDDIW